MRFCYVLLLAVIPSLCFCQGTSTGNAATAGPCSPAVAGNNNTVRIDCKIDLAQGQKVLDILNKILANQMDLTTVNEKLDEILKNVNPNRPVKVYTCEGHWGTMGPAAGANLALIGGMGTLPISSRCGD